METAIYYSTPSYYRRLMTAPIKRSSSHRRVTVKYSITYLRQQLQPACLAIYAENLKCIRTLQFPDLHTLQWAILCKPLLNGSV